MNFSTYKKLALTSAIALTLGLGSQAHAQTAVVGASFTTADALTIADAGDIEFGTHAINVSGTDTLALTVTAANIATTGGTTNCAGAVTPGTTCNEVVAPATSGGVDVDAPVSGTDVQIAGTVTTDFADANLSLGTLTYTHDVVVGAALPAAFDGTTIEVTTAGTDEFVGVGGTITITGTPAAATTFNDAEVTFNISY